ncbi:MAG: hypothetical protein HWE25_10340 [Alphaproteobacteria bacterium]|nr:hypothetical protein [Alphaproteobacteria bacterium]
MNNISSLTVRHANSRPETSQNQDETIDYTPATSGSTFTLNTTEGDVFKNAKSTELANGNFVTIWKVDGNSFGQIFSATGERIGEEFEVDGTAGIAALSGGGFVVAWTRDGIWASIYDDDGHRLGRSVASNDDGLGGASVQATNDGGFLLSWTSNIFKNGGNELGSMARFFAANGAPTSDELTLSLYSDRGTHSTPVIAEFDDGGFVAAYMTTAPGANEMDVVLRFFDSSGTAIIAGDRTGDRVFFTERNENNIRIGHQRDPDIAILENGNILVTWTTDQSPNSYSNTEIRAAILDPDGYVIGEEFQVNTFTANDQYNSKIHILSDGTFVVAWQTGDTNWGANGGIAGQRYDIDGNPLGEEFQVFSTHLALFDGGFIATSIDDGISAQIFEFEVYSTPTISGNIDNNRLDGTAGGDTIHGNGGDDSVSGGDGADFIRGGGGNDFIRGNAGSDTVYGGSGDDAIWAGAGDDSADHYYGGVGSDTLAGGLGDDLVVGGAGQDLVFGGEGDDTLYAGAVADPNSDIYENANDRVWAGAGNDVVYGDLGDDMLGGGDGDDLLKGAGGDDILFAGKSGDDTLMGGDRDDLIYGSNGNDVVMGEDGNDELYGGSGNDFVSGGNDNDTLYGGSGGDTLNGGGGDDTLRPGDGPDILIFSAESGNDVVEGFDISEDTLDISETATEFTDRNDVAAQATENETGLLLDLGDGNTVLMVGVGLADIDQMTFIF